MNILTLQELTLKNFKGIKNFVLVSKGQNVGIHADNALGKTTIIDASSWLLFGKDSAGKANAQFKPNYTTGSKTGQEIHNLETEVTGVYEFNGKVITLKKRLYEKYTKKRGEAQKEFTGNKYKFWVDSVPETKTVFTKKVDEIIDKVVFKLITDPYEFNNLDWEKRRVILLEICGDVPDNEVANTLFPAVKDKDKYATLIGIINDCGIESHKKKVKAKKADINKELDQIPIRITENLETSKGVEKPEQKDKDLYDKDLAVAQEKLRSLQSNEALSKKQVRLNEVYGEIQKINNEADQKLAEAKKPLQGEIDKLYSDRRVLANDISSLSDDISRDKKRNVTNSDARDKIRDRWYAENEKEFSNDSDCLSCGALPEHQLKHTKEAFNKTKADRLEAISAEGLPLKESFDQREKDIESAKVSIDTKQKAIDGIDKDLKIKNAGLEEFKAPVDTKALEKEKGVLESEIKALKNGSLVQENNAKVTIQEIEDKIAIWNTSDAEYNAAEKSRLRIKELKSSEKDLAEEFERLESELFLIEKFITKQAEMLEGNVGDRFKLARFKLFKEQINGGIEPCCETIFKGVGFNSSLNSGAKINVGLDIISTLSEFYGYKAPIFIDNSEGCTKIIDIDTQVIKLVVDKKCKELTIK